MIAIVDYGMGNINSIYKAMQKIGANVVVTSDKDTIKKSSGIIIPGVGAFKEAMINLENSDLVDLLKEEAKNKKPILGICLGMQLVLESSDEMGFTEGLSLIEGSVKKFDIGRKVPHIGWNSFKKNMDHNIFSGIKDNSYVYFVHSHHGVCEDKFVGSYCSYDIDFPAVIIKENIIAMQFHPEKSGEVGLKLLENFKNIVEKGMQ